MLPNAWHLTALCDRTDLLTGLAFASKDYSASTASAVRLLSDTQAIQKLGGTMPERLPVPEKRIQQIVREKNKRIGKKS